MKPVNILSYVSIFILATACLSITKIQDELGMDSSVPMPVDGNEQIIIYNTSFDCLINAFLSSGYRITQENEDRGYFNCEKVGDHRTNVRHVIILVDDVATVTTEYKATIEEYQPIWIRSRFRDGGGRMSYSFLSGLNAVADCGSVRFN